MDYQHPSFSYDEENVSRQSERLRQGMVTSAELTTAALERVRAYNCHLNAVVTVLADAALDAAADADREIQAGRWRGPLHGIPIGLKDIIDTRDIRTARGSEFFRSHVPAADADLARRLDTAGAVLIGKLHTHELAYGPTGDTSCFGPARNPHDLDRITGGSSGGSAAAVATGMCMAAVGSDTGGSVRIPAALCGVVGLKPTFGRISRHGVFPLSWSLDHVGPITRTVRDNALLLGALCGYDPRDPGSIRRTDEDFTSDLNADVAGTRIGVPDTYYFDHVDPEVNHRVRDALAAWAELGVVVEPVTIPELEEIRYAHRTVVEVEAYAIHRDRFEERPDGFGETVRQLLADGRSIPAWQYAEALRSRTKARHALTNALQDVHALVTPTLPLTAPLIGQTETTAAGIQETVRSALTRLLGHTNLAGYPSLSVPCGHSSQGLPIGVQLIGKPWDEVTLYRLAHALEAQRTPVSDRQ